MGFLEHEFRDCRIHTPFKASLWVFFSSSFDGMVTVVTVQVRLNIQAFDHDEICRGPEDVVPISGLWGIGEHGSHGLMVAGQRANEHFDFNSEVV